MLSLIKAKIIKKNKNWLKLVYVYHIYRLKYKKIRKKFFIIYIKNNRNELNIGDYINVNLKLHTITIFK